MKPEIVKWYSERYYQPHKMIQAGIRWGFDQAQVESAMIHCYHKIVNENKLVHDCDVARYVRNVCKDVEVAIRTEELAILYESKDRLDRYKNCVIATCVITVIINALLTLFYITLGGV